MGKNKGPVEQSMHEREKELNCLYNVANLMIDHEKSLEEIFDVIVGYLPPSWQYPDIACARITFRGQEYVSAGFKPSRWKQSAYIFNGSQKVGCIEVYYQKKRPVMDEGPFLKEERILIDTIACQVGNAYKRIKLEDTLKERIKELGCLYGVSNIIEC